MVDIGHNTYPFLILSFGGTVFGTIKRSFWVPFTYNYNEKRQDKREQTETKYIRSIFADPAFIYSTGYVSMLYLLLAL